MMIHGHDDSTVTMRINSSSAILRGPSGCGGFFILAITTTVALLVCGCASMTARQDPPDEWQWARSIPHIQAPRIPTGAGFDITRLGAVADGNTLATDAISKAIDACASAGGGRVIVPAGRFLTGPFKLASNVELHLEKSATL